MESQRYAFKIEVAALCDVPSADFILFFHRMIQEGGVKWEVPIDVTDYSHVPDGPGVMLICHEAHYSTDRGGGRLGLRCATKRGASGSAADRIRWVIGKTLRMAAAMEAHEVLRGRVSFNTSAVTLWVEDRLVAPNDEATYRELAPVTAEVVGGAWGYPPKISHGGPGKECLRIEIATPERPAISEILARL